MMGEEFKGVQSIRIDSQNYQVQKKQIWQHMALHPKWLTQGALQLLIFVLTWLKDGNDSHRKLVGHYLTYLVGVLESIILMGNQSPGNTDQ
jgi:hypothetical protein